MRGPGVRIVIRDPDGGVDAAEILDTVQELRDAGAESIEVAERRVVVEHLVRQPAGHRHPGDPGLRGPAALAVHDPGDR